MSLDLLEEHTALPSTTLDFTAFISPLYDDYEFHFIGINPTIAGGQALQMRMGTGPGPTFDPSAIYNYGLLYAGVGDAPTQVSGTGVTAIDLTHSTTAVGLYSTNGRLRLSAPQAARNKHVEGKIQSVVGASPALYQWHATGVYISAAALTGVQFFFAAGDIAAGGIVRALGVRA